jgi:endonuclease/exonuclease/phosphatase family metal-dependent hydrolase
LKSKFYFFLFLITIACSPNSKRASLSFNDFKETFIATIDSLQIPKTSNQLISKDANALKIISWNIQDLGQTKNEEEIAFIVDVLKDFDIVAIQEVVAKHPAGAQKVAQIADELNRKGSKWDYRISNPTNSHSAYMSERYAYIWKTSKLDIVGRPYLDDVLASEIIREPFIANFKLKSNNEAFVMVNFHSRKFNDNPEMEIKHFSNYLERLNTDKLLIVGDFNLKENHNVWDALYKQGFKSAESEQKTTLKRKCPKGRYLSHAIDNIYYSKSLNYSSSGVVDYITKCDNLKSARLISDHIPVYLEFTISAK